MKLEAKLLDFSPPMITVLFLTRNTVYKSRWQARRKVLESSNGC